MDFEKIKPFSFAEKMEALSYMADYTKSPGGVWVPCESSDSLFTTSSSSPPPATTWKQVQQLAEQLIGQADEKIGKIEAMAKVTPAMPAGKLVIMPIPPEAQAAIKAKMENCDCETCRKRRTLEKYKGITDRVERLKIYGEAIAATLPPEIDRGRDRIGQLLAVAQGCFEYSVHSLAKYHQLPRKPKNV